MPYTPMSDLGQQGLFDITRTLLQQPDLGALSDALTRLVRQSALADSAAIVLWHSGSHRASYFSTRENGKAFEYEDETYLAHGPIRRILSRPEALHCNFEEFRQAWARHDVKPVVSRSVRLVHPSVGELTLHLSKLAVEGTEGQMLVLHHAEPGTTDAQRLALLGSLVRT